MRCPATTASSPAPWWSWRRRSVRASIASDLARSVNAGLATAEAAVCRYADAVAARDGALQAFVAFDREQAIEAARAIDSLHAKGALAGVPVAVKDIIDTAQYETCYGSPVYRGHRPPPDAGGVQLLRGG